MAGVDGGVVGEAEKAFLDALAEHLVAAALKVGTAYATAEERIASEDPVLNFGIEADAALGMARGADDLQGAFAHLDDFAVFQVAVGKLTVAVE